MIKRKISKKYTNHEYTRALDTVICLDLLEEIAKDNKTDIKNIFSQKIYPQGMQVLKMHKKSNPINIVEHVYVKKDYSKSAVHPKNVICIGKLYKKMWMNNETDEVFVEYAIESTQPDFFI